MKRTNEFAYSFHVEKLSEKFSKKIESRELHEVITRGAEIFKKDSKVEADVDTIRSHVAKILLDGFKEEDERLSRKSETDHVEQYVRLQLSGITERLSGIDVDKTRIVVDFAFLLTEPFGVRQETSGGRRTLLEDFVKNELAGIAMNIRDLEMDSRMNIIRNFAADLKTPMPDVQEKKQRLNNDEPLSFSWPPKTGQFCPPKTGSSSFL